MLPDVAGLEAEVEGNRVVVTVARRADRDLAAVHDPRRPRRDGHGGAAGDASPRTCRCSARSPATTVVRAADIEDETVDVEVLANDEDPDGTLDALTVTVAAGDARVLGDGTVRLSSTDADQLDQLHDHRPRRPVRLRVHPRARARDAAARRSPRPRPSRCTAARPIDIPLADHVRAADGGEVVITEAAKVSAVHSDGAIARQGPDDARSTRRRRATSARTRSRSRSPTAPAPTTPRAARRR